MMAMVERQTAARLRGQLAAVGARHQGARIPPRLRAEIIAHARAWRAAGASMRTIAAALGVAPESIRRWTQQMQSASTAPPALVPVRVVAARTPAVPAPLALVSPRGFRVEGLGLADVRALLAALG
jgi:transposase-like protein